MAPIFENSRESEFRKMLKGLILNFLKLILNSNRDTHILLRFNKKRFKYGSISCKVES